MSLPPSAAQTAQHIMAGATFGGGLLEWLTINSSAVTALAVASTAIASIGFGFWNAKSNSDRNKVNRRDILEKIYYDLEKAGKSSYYIKDLKDTLK